MGRDIPELITVPREALAALVDYNYAAEEADYCREGEPESGHIFAHILALQDALQAYLRA